MTTASFFGARHTRLICGLEEMEDRHCASSRASSTGKAVSMVRLQSGRTACKWWVELSSLTQAPACHGHGQSVQGHCSFSDCPMVIAEAARSLFPILAARSLAVYASGGL